MNKGLKGLLVAVLAFGSAVASDSHNKTHMNVRTCRDGVPAYTTFHEMKHVKNDGELGIGRGNVELTGFYGRSVNDTHFAKNFYPKGLTQITVGASSLAGLLAYHPSVYNELLLHDVSATSDLAGTIKFDPKQTVYGGRLDYFQRLDSWFEGLYAHVAIPFLQQRNDINLQVSGETARVETADGKSYRIGLEDLLTGKAINRIQVSSNDANKHTPLKYAKMCSNEKTGLGDIRAKVGYRFLEGEKFGDKYHAGVSVGAILPTASKPDAQYLWAARTGDSKWGITVGLDGSAMLWEENEQNLKVIAEAEYAYLLEGSEKRTLGLKSFRFYDDTIVNEMFCPTLSPYYLVGTKGSKGLQPLANVSTLSVDVKMGSQFDGTLAFAYNNGGFTLDLGYNIFWKEAERIDLKTSCNTTCTPSYVWEDNKYAVADLSYNAATTEFQRANTIACLGTASRASDAKAFIQATDLDTKAAETPAQLIHKVFAGVGYRAENWRFPAMAGAGVAYDIPANNHDGLKGYSFWAKLGLAF